MKNDGEFVEKRKSLLIIIITYVCVLLLFTVINRPITISAPKTMLFWSYREWIKGNGNLGKEIIANVMMFFPLGFLVPFYRSKRTLITVILISITLSFTIESLQLLLNRGLFEFDDVFNNTLGGVVGWQVHNCLKKYLADYVFMIGFLFIAIAFLVVYLNGNEEEQNYEKEYCVQVDDVVEGRIKGFAFLYEQKSDELRIKLKSGAGKLISVPTIYHISRNDVNQYFLCKRDYTYVGFQAILEDVDPCEEYEIVLNFGGTLDVETSIYVTGDRIHYIKDKELQEPEGIDIVENGTLRVYRPDYHCWVYQYEGALYWIADSEFLFEDDGSTYIQYQLWTTQTERLPEKRQENNWLWDNIGGNFEDYEINGEFGRYRVMKRELPKEYSIISIETGYFKDGKWVWHSFFRPVYEDL